MLIYYMSKYGMWDILGHSGPSPMHLSSKQGQSKIFKCLRKVSRCICSLDGKCVGLSHDIIFNSSRDARFPIHSGNSVKFVNFRILRDLSMVRR
ncbi:hypothetical protein Scep_010901 [Stephania cephalantha]|uniref:Uncharacterized protein n=1 Tax=Stephania cephalantha TaxID=152367 RepID=A0AAP0PHI3_9MAGN